MVQNSAAVLLRSFGIAAGVGNGLMYVCVCVCLCVHIRLNVLRVTAFIWGFEIEIVFI